MNHAGIRSALSRIAWAYLLIHLHFRLNNLDLLPDWAGYLDFLRDRPAGRRARDLPLLRPFCILLGAVSGVDWLSFLLTRRGVHRPLLSPLRPGSPVWPSISTSNCSPIWPPWPTGGQGRAAAPP